MALRNVERLLKSALLFFVLAQIGHAQTRWVGSWAAAQQLLEPHNSLPNDDLSDATLRQVVHLSLGGEKIRVHLSNRFGTAPLHFASVHIAHAVAPGSAKIDASTDRAVTFSGSQDVTVPAGADYVSDPVSLSAAPLSDLAISIHLGEAPARQTGHPGSRATSFVTRGDLVAAPDLPNAKRVEHWYFIAGVEVAAANDAGAIVILGDSITDGRGATTDGNDRWPDLLARRLQSQSRKLAVLNLGIGGNRVLLDSLGPNALARFDQDVLAQPGARYLIILEGVNDLGMLTHDGEAPPAAHQDLVRRLTAAYEQLVIRAHSHGIKVIGCTIMPYGGSSFYHPGPPNEADRQAVNHWIRAPGHFDAVIDFDKIMRDPEQPERLLAKFDSGDHLHPSPAGFAAMAEAVPFSLFSSSFEPHPQIAFTFDDLPAHGPLPPRETRVQVASKILAALRDAQVPPVYGFVNGQGAEQQPGGAAVLAAWRDTGNPLGNHSWSHMNLNQHSLEEFEADVMRNEPLLESLMKNQDWHWFRFPFLAEGDTPAKAAGIRRFLEQHRYKVAGVTMSFGDYMWNEPYARCRTKGDDKAIATLESSYLAAAQESIGYYRQLSHAVYGRDIPYVLLMHIGAFDAEMLPRLLSLYQSSGFEFVTLEQAQRDDAYKLDMDLQLPPGPDSLEAAMSAHSLPLPARTPPAAMLDAICR